MSNRDEIPQDVWDKAVAIATGKNVREGALFSEAYVVPIARAILAAKAEARGGIADMADAYADVEDFSAIHAQCDQDNLVYRTREATLRAFGAAVRTLNDEVNTAHKNSEG